MAIHKTYSCDFCGASPISIVWKVQAVDSKKTRKVGEACTSCAGHLRSVGTRRKADDE